jgi:hypothetical protein
MRPLIRYSGLGSQITTEREYAHGSNVFLIPYPAARTIPAVTAALHKNATKRGIHGMKRGTRRAIIRKMTAM